MRTNVHTISFRSHKRNPNEKWAATGAKAERGKSERNGQRQTVIRTVSLPRYMTGEKTDIVRWKKSVRSLLALQFCMPMGFFRGVETFCVCGSDREGERVFFKESSISHGLGSKHTHTPFPPPADTPIVADSSSSLSLPQKVMCGSSSPSSFSHLATIPSPFFLLLSISLVCSHKNCQGRKEEEEECTTATGQ